MTGNAIIEQLPVLPLLQTFLLLLAIVAGRYFLFAGAGYFACTRLSRSRPKWVRRISSKNPAPEVLRGEIFWSLLSSVIFAAAGVAIVRAWQFGHARIYDRISDYGITWFLLSPLVLMFLHDTWFYWTHRWMHRPAVFRRFHEVHHRSRPPTAWAAFSFHPLEAFVEALILPLLVLVVPTHWSVLLFFLTVMTVLSVINHLGYEIYPGNFATHWFCRYWVSATHHQTHHEKVSWNYGLYFNLWDRWMGTEHPGYEQKFQQVQQGEITENPSPVPSPFPARDADVIIVGAGLSGSLLALRLAETHPELRILLLERESRAGGNHTWSFHENDLPAESLQWIKRLASRKWDRYEVDFPAFSRTLNSPYYSIRSELLHQKVSETLGERFRPGTAIASVHSKSVFLTDGTELQCHCVIDARGMNRGTGKAPIPGEGYQKFVGLDLLLETPHGLEHPVLMDVRVPQNGDFRFIYLLPWTPDSLLIEDTFYSDQPELDVAALSEGILDYAHSRNWKVRSILRTETGCLPIPLQKLTLPVLRAGSPITIGARAGIFHDTTGYSLPYTVRLIERLTRLTSFDAEKLREETQAFDRELAPQRRYLRLLNRLMFRAATPSQRFRVLQHFYRLPEPLIHRFYAGNLTLADQARILMGRPPVPVFKAVKTILAHPGRAATNAARNRQNPRSTEC